MSTNDLITTGEAADLLTVSQQTVLNMIKRGELRHTRLAKRIIRVKRSDVLKMTEVGVSG